MLSADAVGLGVPARGVPPAALPFVAPGIGFCDEGVGVLGIVSVGVAAAVGFIVDVGVGGAGVLVGVGVTVGVGGAGVLVGVGVGVGGAGVTVGVTASVDIFTAVIASVVVVIVNMPMAENDNHTKKSTKAPTKNLFLIRTPRNIKPCERLLYQLLWRQLVKALYLRYKDRAINKI